MTRNNLCYVTFGFTEPFIVLDHMDAVATKAAENGLNFKLREGFSAETSGKTFTPWIMCWNNTGNRWPSSYTSKR